MPTRRFVIRANEAIDADLSRLLEERSHRSRVITPEAREFEGQVQIATVLDDQIEHAERDVL